TGIEVVHVPYAGTAAALKDLMAGNVSWTLDSLTALIPFINNGDLRALAVSSRNRSPVLPDVPTISEAAMPGYESSSWFAVFGPAGMDRKLVDKIHADALKAFEDPETRSLLAGLGVSVPESMSVEDFEGYVRSEKDKYAGIIKRAGISVN